VVDSSPLKHLHRQDLKVPAYVIVSIQIQITYPFYEKVKSFYENDRSTILFLSKFLYFTY